jgi:hypothetical protein
MPAPVLDRHAHSISSGGTTTTISVTTGAANTLVLVASSVGGTSTSVQPALSIAGAGLAWTAIDVATAGSGHAAGGFYNALQVWWAIAASQLTAQTVTITSNQTADDCATVYASFTGAYNAAPVDPHAQAVNAFFVTVSALPLMNLSSSNADDIAVVVGGANINYSFGTAQSPAIVIDAALNAGGSRIGSVGMVYSIFSTPQSAVSVGFGNLSASPYGLIGVMLTADAPPITSKARVMVMA